MPKRVNRHKLIIDPATEHFSEQGFVCQNYHSPRSMPGALAGHPDLVITKDGITHYIELKPHYHDGKRNRKDNLKDTQCAWFWKMYPAFCRTVQYVIATDLNDLIVRVAYEDLDITVPDMYYDQLIAYKREHIDGD